MIASVIEPWVLWALLAATMQSVRTATQKQLTAHVSAEAATLVRYLFGIPFVLTYLGVIFYTTGAAFPILNWTFAWCVVGAGVLQVVATVLLIRLFTLRNFAVGSAYVRAEIVITALLGMLLFAEMISLLGWIGIGVCSTGLIIITVTRSQGIGTLWNQSALYGLGAGLAFSLTSLLIRHGSLSLQLEGAVLPAAITLTAMILLQTVLCLFMVAQKNSSELKTVLVHWKPGVFVGITSVAGSAGWFTAFTLERAAYVKTLGQIEILLTVLISVFFFREKPTRGEWAGMVLIVGGVIVLLLAP